MQQSHSKYKNDSTRLYNWYEPEIGTVPENVGKLICQRTNCTYDRDIKKRFRVWVIAFAMIAVILIVIPSFFFDWTVSKVFLTLVCPVVPVFQWMTKNITKVNQSVETLERLNAEIGNKWEQVKDGNSIDECDFRQIQDGIYLNRKQNPLIPNFIYNSLWNALENQTRYTVGQLVEEYKNS